MYREDIKARNKFTKHVLGLLVSFPALANATAAAGKQHVGTDPASTHTDTDVKG